MSQIPRDSIPQTKCGIAGSRGIWSTLLRTGLPKQPLWHNRSFSKSSSLNSQHCIYLFYYCQIQQKYKDPGWSFTFHEFFFRWKILKRNVFLYKTLSSSIKKDQNVKYINFSDRSSGHLTSFERARCMANLSPYNLTSSRFLACTHWLKKPRYG